MGNDLALAVLSDQRPLLYSYFKQLFAQVTNPPIDSTREAVVMSVATSVGSERNLLGESPEHAHQLVIDQPILRDSELEALRQVDSRHLQGAHDRHHLAGRRGHRRARARRSSGSAARPTRRSPTASTSSSSPTGCVGARPGRDPGAARGLLGAPPPRARGHAPAGRARDRVGRAARRAPVRDADRLRRRRGQPVRDARDARRSSRRRAGCRRG